MLAINRTPRHDCRTYSDAFEHAVIGMALLAPDGHFLRVNHALERLLGYPREELMAVSLAELTLEQEQELDRESLEHLLGGEIQQYQTEKHYRHRLGHLLPVQVSVSLVRGEDGTPRYYIYQIQDISKYQHILAELRLSGSRLRTLIEQLPLGVALEDEYRRIQLVNTRFCQMLSLPLTAKELEGTDCSVLAADSAYLFARPEFLENRIREIINNRRPVQNETLEMADGRRLQRDYTPVFVDHRYRGSLWTFREFFR